MLSIDQAKKKIEANNKRIGELNVEIKRVSDPVKNASGVYDKKLKNEQDARQKLAMATAEGKEEKEIAELQKAVDTAFEEVRQHNTTINAYRVMWKRYNAESDSLHAEVKQLERLLKFYPVFVYIEKTYSPAAKKFAETLKELDALAREHECNEIFESLCSVVNFPVSENGNMNVSSLFHGIKL